jgi:cytosine/adenosine deaminase-related metal-dependent hydrolase
MAEAGTIILPDWIITTPLEPPKAGWGIRILDDLIADIAPNQELRQRYPNDVVWNANEHILAPGFVDAIPIFTVYWHTAFL